MFFSLNVVHQIDSFCVPKGILYEGSRRRGEENWLAFCWGGSKSRYKKEGDKTKVSETLLLLEGGVPEGGGGR